MSHFPVRKLIAPNTRINDKGATGIHFALRIRSSLEIIDLSDNEISDDYGQKFYRSLLGSNVKEFKLEGNYISDKTLSKIKRLLEIKNKGPKAVAQ